MFADDRWYSLYAALQFPITYRVGGNEQNSAQIFILGCHEPRLQFSHQKGYVMVGRSRLRFPTKSRKFSLF